ncbi:hypothetical protein EDD16DRAFT_1535427 [Pisolithus croceorrhizus]|nr:hypothetical protein EV401DRAFT_1931673 [Pisolithus croceorrhizus]KAI6132220.1 hypothetical protein EDD16DRAFT_1535427 [Pisolithus croceorrhizus]KAI6160063.1 hypothetical protein EDD17DRAFT_1606543 [Pisolithus thermaeus]
MASSNASFLFEFVVSHCVSSIALGRGFTGRRQTKDHTTTATTTNPVTLLTVPPATAPKSADFEVLANDVDDVEGLDDGVGDTVMVVCVGGGQIDYNFTVFTSSTTTYEGVCHGVAFASVSEPAVTVAARMQRLDIKR